MTTALQVAMMSKIANDEMNGANGDPQCADDTGTWTDGIVETDIDKGVLTSLINADLVWHEHSDRDSCCGLTEKGWLEYKS